MALEARYWAGGEDLQNCYNWTTSRYVGNGFKQEVLILCTLQLEQLQIYIEVIQVILGSKAF